MAIADRNIYQRMIEVQKQVTTVVKNEKIEMKGERSYKAVTHDDVAALLHLPLADAGIVLVPNVIDFKVTEFEIEKTYNNSKYVQRWYRTDIKINVKWINVDKPDDFIESMSAAFALDTSDKGFAKAYSLALKIVLLKVHLLESRDGEERRQFENDNDDGPRSRKPDPRFNANPNAIPPEVQAIRDKNAQAERDAAKLLEQGVTIGPPVKAPTDAEIAAIPKSARTGHINPSNIGKPAKTVVNYATGEVKPHDGTDETFDPGDYVVESGIHKGKSLRDMGADAVREQLKWITEKAKKPLGGNLTRFSEYAEQFLASK